MAIEISPTPVLTGESAKRFTRIMFANRRKKVGPTPTPHLEELTSRIMQFQGEQRRKRGQK